jgi:hypothetical protein
MMYQTRAAPRRRGQALAQTYVRLASNTASATLGIVLGLLLGLHDVPREFPLVRFAQSNPPASILFGCLLLTTILVAVFVSERGQRRDPATVGGRTMRFIASAVLTTLGSAILGGAFGVEAVPTDIPLLGILKERPPLGIALMIVLLVPIVLAPLLTSRDDAPDSHGSRRAKVSPLILSVTTSACSFALFLALLATVVIRPTWCPASICPPPVEKLPLGAVSDTNLAVWPSGVQSFAYAIPGVPEQYSVAKDDLMGAVRIDQEYPPYRVLIGVRNLRDDPNKANNGIIVEQVRLHIDQVVVPGVLNVWTAGYDTPSEGTTLEATYRGEPATATLTALPVASPSSVVTLERGQTSAFDLQVRAQVAGEISFRVEVRYRVTSKSVSQYLMLATRYTVVFGAAPNWHEYHRAGDHFVSGE